MTTPAKSETLNERRVVRGYSSPLASSSAFSFVLSSGIHRLDVEILIEEIIRVIIRLDACQASIGCARISGIHAFSTGLAQEPYICAASQGGKRAPGSLPDLLRLHLCGAFWSKSGNNH